MKLWFYGVCLKIAEWLYDFAVAGMDRHYHYIHRETCPAKKEAP